jgi:DNA-binding transcriptional regulator YbjK
MFAASPSAGQVQIGSTLAATLQNLLAVLEAFTDANIKLMEYFANASSLYVEAMRKARRGMLSQSPPARRLRQAEPHPALRRSAH